MKPSSLIALLLLLGLTACRESIDTSSRYVFSEQTIVSYLEQHNTYSEYVNLMKQVPMSNISSTTVYQLLSARGNYTVFAPTNDAIRRYLEHLTADGLIAAPRWEAFTDSRKLDSIRKVIVRNSILDGGDLSQQVFYCGDFPVVNNGEFPITNLNDHKLTVYIPKQRPDSLYINSDCPLDNRNRDIPTLNGVIHQIHKVIAPEDMTAARYFQQILEQQKEGYLVFAKCLQACGLMDTLSAIRDEVYETLYQRGLIPDLPKYMSAGFTDMSGNANSNALAPEHRKYGFTIFAESDAFWRSQGIDPLAKDVPALLTKWIQEHSQYLPEHAHSSGKDYASDKHLLYQWTTYHILPMKLEANKLVYHCNESGYTLSAPYRYTIPVMEWYCTLGKRRLLKIYESKESQGVYLNRFPLFSKDRKSDGHEVGCAPDKVGCFVDRENELTVVNDIINACIYPLDAPLAYNEETRNNLGRERLRFDCFALFPEAMSNGIRRADSMEDKYQHVYIPADHHYQYFSNMSILSDDTNFIHFNGYRVSWPNYDGDEDKAIGHYDIIFTLPPVPKRGTYELRYKVLATAARGVTQIYFGSDKNNLPVAGIPIDLTKSVVDLYGGEDNILDTDDEDYNAEIDKKLRNNNLMKGCKSVGNGPTSTERDNIVCSRRIIWRGTLDPDLTYHVRFKSVLDSDKKELYMDYLEFCPKEVYDNPEAPEDLY